MTDQGRINNQRRKANDSSIIIFLEEFTISTSIPGLVEQKIKKNKHVFIWKFFKIFVE